MGRTYTKREFLKLMGGLSLGFLPFISCYDNNSKAAEKQGQQGKPEDAIANDEELTVTDSDVVMLTRNEAAYAQFNEGFNKRIQQMPKYIAVCKTEKGTQYSVKKAVEEGLQIAVKSGGHSFEGFSSNNGGMVINLSQMKKVTWLSGNEVIVESGCLLQDIHNEFFPKKKLLPSGSCGTVGIGGLTLGGGYGFFSRKYGLTCDSLLEVTLIAADGKKYSTKDDEKLLWACKGGGNGSFGVVTSFRFKVYDMPATFSSYNFKFRNLDTTRFSTLLQKYFAVSDNLPEDAFAAFVLNGKTLTVLITSYQQHSNFENQLAPLIEEADSYTPSLDKNLPQSMKRFYGRKGPIYFKNASAGLYKGLSDFTNIATQLFDTVVSNKGIVFQINTLGGKINDPKFDAASCYPHRALPYLGELQSYWDSPSQEQSLTEAFEEIQTIFRDSGITAHYRNYPDINFNNWQQSYYGSNYAKLQEVKNQYDPGNVFKYAQSIEV